MQANKHDSIIDRGLWHCAIRRDVSLKEVGFLDFENILIDYDVETSPLHVNFARAEGKSAEALFEDAERTPGSEQIDFSRISNQADFDWHLAQFYEVPPDIFSLGTTHWGIVLRHYAFMENFISSLFPIDWDVRQVISSMRVVIVEAFWRNLWAKRLMAALAYWYS